MFVATKRSASCNIGYLSMGNEDGHYFREGRLAFLQHLIRVLIIISNNLNRQHTLPELGKQGIQISYYLAANALDNKNKQI